MAPGTCEECGRVMLATDSCDHKSIFLEGRDQEPIPYGQERWWQDLGIAPAERCHDCNVAIGGYHHPGCDMEECPVCGGQLFVCDCEDETGQPGLLP
jgi:hypothetical protein